MRTGYNNLVITVYSGSTLVWSNDMVSAEQVTFDTLYPGGLFGSCAFYIPRDVTRQTSVIMGLRVVVRNGIVTVWEGKIVNLALDYQDINQGMRVTCLGYWGDLLMMRSWRKWWADQRGDTETWITPTVASDANDKTVLEIVGIDRTNRLRFTPKSEAFTTGWYVRCVYLAPTGETMKRITFNYDLQEGGQQWTLALYNGTSTATVWSVVASGTGSVDHTFATPSASMWFFFQSNANQTPPSDGTIYGQVSDVTVYGETGSINLTEITKDVRAKLTDLSADESLIASNAYSLVPFISEVDTCADILNNAAGYGDSSYNPWAAGVRESDLASDGRPILFVERQPVLTAYDYAVRLDDDNLRPGVTIERDVSTVVNWVAIRYIYPSGRHIWLTPDDDAALKDTTSIAAYGQREAWLQMDMAGGGVAKNYGVRYLTRWKDAQWTVSSALVVQGYIRGTGNERIPASQIRAGKRVKVENFLSTLSGDGLTLLITGTSYNDTEETCSISVGVSHSLDFWLARNE